MRHILKIQIVLLFVIFGGICWCKVLLPTRRIKSRYQFLTKQSLGGDNLPVFRGNRGCCKVSLLQSSSKITSSMSSRSSSATILTERYCLCLLLPRQKAFIRIFQIIGGPRHGTSTIFD